MIGSSSDALTDSPGYRHAFDFITEALERMPRPQAVQNCIAGVHPAPASDKAKK